MKSKHQMEHQVKNQVTNYVKKGVKIIFAICFGALLVFLVGYLVMRLWNWLMPELFSLSTIGYWQAVGLIVLAKIFFGFGSGGPGKKGIPKNRPLTRRCGPMRNEFSKWKHYDEFWKSEGEQAFENYLSKLEKGKNDEENPKQ